MVMAVISYWVPVILSGFMPVLFSRFASCESVVLSRMFVPGDVLDEVCVVFMVSTSTLVVSIVISLVEVDGVLAVSLLEVKITYLGHRTMLVKQHMKFSFKGTS